MRPFERRCVLDLTKALTAQPARSSGPPANATCGYLRRFAAWRPLNVNVRRRSIRADSTR